MDLSELCESLLGKPCWSVIAGPGTGSHVHLDFGEKRLRARPVPNEHLTDDQQRYEGEYSLMIYCSWEVRVSGVVQGDSESDNRVGGPMLTALDRLVGETVDSAVVEPDTHVLELRFTGHAKLTLIPDQDPDPDWDNYVLFTPEAVVAVSTTGDVTVESPE